MDFKSYTGQILQWRLERMKGSSGIEKSGCEARSEEVGKDKLLRSFVNFYMKTWKE